MRWGPGPGWRSCPRLPSGGLDLLSWLSVTFLCGPLVPSPILPVAHPSCPRLPRARLSSPHLFCHCSAPGRRLRRGSSDPQTRSRCVPRLLPESWVAVPSRPRPLCDTQFFTHVVERILSTFERWGPTLCLGDTAANTPERSLLSYVQIWARDRGREYR